MIRTFLAFLRILPARLELEHLRWARREMHPLHPDLPIVIHRINALEDYCRV